MFLIYFDVCIHIVLEKETNSTIPSEKVHGEVVAPPTISKLVMV